jgi:hypothetical protein
VKKRLLTAIFVGASFAGMAYSATFAKECAATFCLDATENVNGGTGYVQITYHTYANVAGQIAYECQLGPIPFICDLYFIQGIAYLPFGSPSVVAGNLPVKSYTLGTNPDTGQYSWLYNYKETNTGNRTLYLTGRSYADTHSGTGTYWISTGTGPGHLVNDYYKQQVKVP